LAEMSKTEMERAKAAMLAKILAGAGDKDHLQVSVVPVENGLRLRLEVEEGVVQAVGKMSTMLPSQISRMLGDGVLGK
ncbi:MAG: hypothetical protein U9N87_11635, partial [Planctomycetota bacterium]|nr:hypothetical protein [Planctomycetota bacterium]